MITIRLSRIAVSALVMSMIAIPATAAARSPCEVLFGWALGKIVRNPLKYRTTRQLETYADELFPDVLRSKLATANSHYSVADGGGGEGMAGYDIIRQYPGLGRVSVFSIEKPENLDDDQNGRWLFNSRYRHAWGRRLELLSSEDLGLHDLWLDAMGAFAYADRPDLTLATYLRTLKRGGLVLINAGEQRENPSFVTVGGVRLNLLDWLTSIENLDVGKLADGSRSIRIRDHDRTICIPELALLRLGWSRSRPPIRYFAVRPNRCAKVTPPTSG